MASWVSRALRLTATRGFGACHRFRKKRSLWVFVIGSVLVVGGWLVGYSGFAVAGAARSQPGYLVGMSRRTRPSLRVDTGGPRRPLAVTLPSGIAGLRLTSAGSGRRIPSGFLGLSIEYSAIEAYAGSDPNSIDPVLVQLIRNLTPGQDPVLRIGGDSTDRTWWPIANQVRPPGVKYALDTGWLWVTRALARTLGAHLILGINLEADTQQVAAAEARAMTAWLDPASVDALELGNEPELYSIFGWYKNPDGVSIPGRPASYDFNAYTRDFSHIASGLPAVPLAGPAIGAVGWMHLLRYFLAAEPRVRLVTLHRYPLSSCGPPPTSRGYPTIGHLLAPSSSNGLAQSIAPYVRIAHARHLPLRVDEINTDSCGSSPTVTHSFASALWVLDTLFEIAGVGADGVNIHTYPGATYNLFTVNETDRGWSVSVAAEYYGMLMFEQAAPPGSTLLPLPVPGGGDVKAWATVGRHGAIRVVLINEGIRQRRVTVRSPAVCQSATLEQLRAPSIFAQTDITLGGRSFGSETQTGRLPGPSDIVSVRTVAGRYLLTLPAASATMLTLQCGPPTPNHAPISTTRVSFARHAAVPAENARPRGESPTTRLVSQVRAPPPPEVVLAACCKRSG